MKYSIIIPTYNHCEDLLKPCLESIKKYTDLQNIEILVVANGCTDSTKEYVESLGNPFQLIWFDEALGYTKATNEGIKKSIGEFVIVLNNDTEILPSNKNDWVNALEEPFRKNSKLMLTGPLSLYDNDANSDFIVFWCAMIRKEIFDKIGILDEIFSPGFGEDIDFAVRIKQAGYEIKCISDVEFKNGTNVGNFPLYHKNNKTFSEISTYSSVTVKRNKLILRQRYNKMKDELLKYKIGVITPVYNDEKFIVDSLNSVNFQTFPNVIHYIYSDCGSDNSKNIIDNYSFTKDKVIINGEINQGQSNARNVLIKQAIKDGCTHLAFLDADDHWFIDHLESSLIELGNNDIVYSTPNFILENGDFASPVNIPIPKEFIGRQLKHNNFIWISSVVAKIDCFLNNEFDNALNSVEDWDMWCRLYDQDRKFVFKKSTTTNYIVKSNGGASLGHTKHSLLDQKHKLLPKLKLHLACGHDYQDDYINIDLYAPDTAKVDFRHDVRSLPYEDNSVDEIRAFHIIEHFDFFEGQEVLKEWYRVLKPGGKLYLETPDFLETCRAFVEADNDFRVALYGHFFAHPWVPGQTHKFLFTEDQLRSQLSWAKFNQVIRVAPASNYVMPNTIKLFLTVEAYK